jgi:hypothetical protein
MSNNCSIIRRQNNGTLSCINRFEHNDHSPSILIYWIVMIEERIALIVFAIERTDVYKKRCSCISLSLSLCLCLFAPDRKNVIPNRALPLHLSLTGKRQMSGCHFTDKQCHQFYSQLCCSLNETRTKTSTCCCHSARRHCHCRSSVPFLLSIWIAFNHSLGDEWLFL